jgi:hypothetical protein
MKATRKIISLSKVRKAREKEALPPGFDALSFVSKRKPRGNGFNFWDVTPTGSYADDCQTGAALAAEYLAFIGAWPTHGNGALLGFIVRDMIDPAGDGARWSGVHVGFLAGVNHYAMVTAFEALQRRSRIGLPRDQS